MYKIKWRKTAIVFIILPALTVNLLLYSRSIYFQKNFLSKPPPASFVFLSEVEEVEIEQETSSKEIQNEVTAEPEETEKIEETITEPLTNPTVETTETTEIVETVEISTIPPETTQAATGLNGYYTQKYSNGDIYTGYFVNNIRSGNGTYTWANGIVYIGEWVNGEPNGNGSYVYPTTEPPAIPHLDIKVDVTVIGDSVILGAKNKLENTIPGCYVDAKVSRSVNAGVDIFRDLQNKSELHEYVVIALGTNGNYDDVRQMTKIIDELDSGHRLIFVTPFDGRSNNNSEILKTTSDWVRKLPAQYDYITVADWADSISSQTNILARDTVHMGGQTSINLYVNLIINAINEASQKPAK